MKVVPLDKILAVGTTYTTHRRLVYVINKIGTDDTSSQRLVIDGKNLGVITDDVAPMHKTNSYIVGPLDLGNMFYVIPPDTDFYLSGSSGAYMRIIGKILQLEPGETTPTEYQSRFNSQPDNYRMYVTGTYSFGTATAWSDDDEVTLYTLTPVTIEKYIFNNIVMIDYTGFSASAGDVVIRFYLDNNPIEYLASENLDTGIDLLSIPHRDDVSVNETPFTFKDLPIEVEGDHTFKVTATNVSGSDISLSSASITFYAVCDYHRST